MKSPPEWTDTQECPVDGCDGEYWRDVGGSAMRPVMEYPSTCHHDINTCNGCNEKKAIKRKFSWPVEGLNPMSPGEIRVRRFCEECNNPDTIREVIPDWVFERGHVSLPEVEE